MTTGPKRPAHKRTKLAESGTLNPNGDAVLDPLFQGSEFFDPMDLLQVKYEMLRRVENDSYPVATVARDFGFSRRHFYEVKKNFMEGGLSGLMPEKRGPKDAHKLDQAVMAFIMDLIATDPALKGPALAALVNKKFKISIHSRSIERALERKKKDR